MGGVIHDCTPGVARPRPEQVADRNQIGTTRPADGASAARRKKPRSRTAQRRLKSLHVTRSAHYPEITGQLQGWSARIDLPGYVLSACERAW